MRHYGDWASNNNNICAFISWYIELDSIALYRLTPANVA